MTTNFQKLLDAARRAYAAHVKRESFADDPDDAGVNNGLDGLHEAMDDLLDVIEAIEAEVTTPKWAPPQTAEEAIKRMREDGDGDPEGTARLNYPHLFAPEAGAGGEVEWMTHALDTGVPGDHNVLVGACGQTSVGTVIPPGSPETGADCFVWEMFFGVSAAIEGTAPTEAEARAAVEASFRSALPRLTGGAGVELPSREAAAKAIAEVLDMEHWDVMEAVTHELYATAADAVLSLLSAAPRVPVGGEGVWQPIETAPRDGTRILVLVPPASIVVAHWWGGKFRLHTLSSLNKLGQPTDWMPLPSFPTKGGADA